MVLDAQVREAKQAKDAKITALNDNTYGYTLFFPFTMVWNGEQTKETITILKYHSLIFIRNLQTST